jgi:hypothetical protein
MRKQLTIFDVEPVISFDSKKATIHRLDSQLRYADVVVQIPRQAKVIDELKPTTVTSYLKSMQLGFDVTKTYLNKIKWTSC